MYCKYLFIPFLKHFIIINTTVKIKMMITEIAPMLYPTAKSITFDVPGSFVSVSVASQIKLYNTRYTMLYRYTVQWSIRFRVIAQNRPSTFYPIAWPFIISASIILLLCSPILPSTIIVLNLPLLAFTQYWQ